jgi:hypothetical protein
VPCKVEANFGGFMSRASLTFARLAALAAPASADVTSKQSNATKGMGTMAQILHAEHPQVTAR